MTPGLNYEKVFSKTVVVFFVYAISIWYNRDEIVEGL